MASCYNNRNRNYPVIYHNVTQKQRRVGKLALSYSGPEISKKYALRSRSRQVIREANVNLYIQPSCKFAKPELVIVIPNEPHDYHDPS